MYLGIDVGKKGGLCLMDSEGSIVEYMATPVIGKEYDIQKMVNFIDRDEIKMIGIENVHAVQISGRSTSFQFGMGKGILIGIVETLGIPYTLVGAKAWQKVSWEGVTKQKDTKKTSLIAATRLFPNETFLATSRSKVPHDGIVDATLIAYYLRTKHEGKLSK